MTPKDEPTGFSDFWNQWRPMKRHTDGRGDARACFASHLKRGVNPQDIIDGAAWFLRNIKERDREFIPLAATWLNRCDYEDGCELERAFQAKQSQRAVEPSNVTTIRAVLPANHFSRRWNNGEIEQAS